MSVLDTIYGTAASAINAITSTASEVAKPVVSAVQSVISPNVDSVESGPTPDYTMPTPNIQPNIPSTPITNLPSGIKETQPGAMNALVQSGIVSPTVTSPQTNVTAQRVAFTDAPGIRGNITPEMAKYFVESTTPLTPSVLVSTTTQTPQKTITPQQSVLASTQARAGYYDPMELGDSITQARARELINLQYKPGTTQPFNSYEDAVRYALEEQRQSATDSTSKRFYANELSKSIEEPIERASEYHALAKETGLPQAANPYEYQADLAVELLKGAPATRSDVFSPVSGEMSKYLPGGREGIQQYQWNTALGKNENVSFMPGLAALQAAEGIEGPYGALYGGTGAESITPERVERVTTSWQTNVPSSANVVTAMPAQVAGTGPDIEVKSAAVNVPTVGGLYVVPGSGYVMGKSVALPSDVTTPIYQQRSDIPAVALEAGVSALDALTSLPSTVTFGVIPAWRPGTELLTKYGQTGSPELTKFQTQLAAVEEQRPSYDAILSEVKEKTDTLNTLTAGKINEQGQFTGTPEEYANIQKLQSDIKTGTNEYNEFQTKYQDVLKQGYSSGAIIKGPGNTYQVAPETQRPYGAFSDWSASVQKLITGATPSQFAVYETTPEFAAAPWYERVGEGIVKTVTSPEQALQSGVQGLALYGLTAGVGEGLGAIAGTGGKVGTVAGGAIKVGESPAVKYGVPAVFGGAGLYSAAEGVDIGGPTLVTPKAGWSKFETNVGEMTGNLLWMGVGAAAPSALARVSPTLSTGAGRVYEAVNFPNVPTIGEIGGGLKGKVSDTLYSMRQTAGGVENIGPKSGLSRDYDILPQPGSLNYLRQKDIAFSPPSPEDITRLGRADARTTEIFNIKTEGGVVKPSVVTEKFTPQKGSLTYLQEKGISFNVPSAEDVMRLRRAEAETEAIFKLKTEGGGIEPVIKEEGKITPMRGSLRYLQEKGIAFSPPSTEDIIRLKRADAITNRIFDIKTEGGVVAKPTVEEGKITPMKGSLRYLQERGIAFNVPSVEDVTRLKRAEALTESIFAAKTEGGITKPSISEGKITPMEGSFTWLKEKGIIPKKETGPVETPEARGLSNYLGKYYEDLVKEVKTAGLKPESPEILSQLRAATKVEEMRLKKASPFERADILKQYDVGGILPRGVEKLTPQVGSISYLKEKGIIPAKETGPEITTSKQQLTDYLAKLHENLISEVKSAGLDPSSPNVKSQIDAELKIRQESIKKLNNIAKIDLFSGRKSLDELLSNKENVINSNRVVINKKTWTNKELAERLKPRRWPTTKPEGVESGKGGQVLIQKLAQKTEQKLKQEAKQESKQVAKQEEQKLEKKKKSLSVESYQNYPVAYNVRDYDMANVELSREYGLKVIPSPRQPTSELQSLLAVSKPSVTPTISFGQKSLQEQPQATVEKTTPSIKNISDTIQKAIQDIIKVPDIAPIQTTEIAQIQIPGQKFTQEQVPELTTKQIPLSKTDIAQIPDIKNILDITQRPELTPKPEITQKPKPYVPLIPIFGGSSLPPGTSGGGHKRKFKPHKQVFEYNFDPWKAARITAKALAAGSNVTRGPKSSLPTSIFAQKPSTGVPKINTPSQKKVAAPQFTMPKIGISKSTNTLKPVSLPSSMPTQKKKGKK